MTEHNLSFNIKSSSRLAGGASRSAGSSLRADRSAPGSLTCTRSSSCCWPEDDFELVERLVGLLLLLLLLFVSALFADDDDPFEGVDAPLPLLPERPDFPDDVTAGPELEDEESSF